MASVFKAKGAKVYTILYYDENGDRRKRSAYTDKAESERLANKLEEEAKRFRDGTEDRKALEIRDHERRPVSEHLDAWYRNMLAKRKSVKHADHYRDRARKVVALVHGARLDDIEGGRSVEGQRQAADNLAKCLRSARLTNLNSDDIQAALDTLISAGWALQTVNHYRAAIRAFCFWAVGKRMKSNPMNDVKGYDAEKDQRHVRRTLTDDELARLIESARTGPERYGMSGELRAMSYRVASDTGFRVAELRSLTPDSFRLTSLKPTIYLVAASTKNGKPADQPISQALAAELRSWLADKVPGEQVFPLHHETARAIRRDLEAASIPYETKEGVADFHSLRAYFVTSLIRAGQHIDKVKKLARHAKPTTTLDHYAKCGDDDLHAAVESRPVPVVNKQPVRLAATGTDGCDQLFTRSDSDPVSNATSGAPCVLGESHKSNRGNEVMSSDYRFSKPPLSTTQPPLQASTYIRSSQPAILPVSSHIIGTSTDGASSKDAAHGANIGHAGNARSVVSGDDEILLSMIG
jgi:site-specific recombinase XerC